MGQNKRKLNAYEIGPAEVPLDPNLDAYYFGEDGLHAGTYHDGTYLADRGVLTWETADFNPVYPRVFAVYSDSLTGPGLGWLNRNFTDDGELPPTTLQVWDPEGAAVYSYSEAGWVLHGAAHRAATDYVFWVERAAASHQIGSAWFTRFRLRRARPTFGGTVATLKDVDLPHPGGANVNWLADFSGYSPDTGFQMSDTHARFDDVGGHPHPDLGPSPWGFSIVFPLDGSAPISSWDGNAYADVALRGVYATPGIGGAAIGRTVDDPALLTCDLSILGATSPYLDAATVWNRLDGDQLAIFDISTQTVSLVAESEGSPSVASSFTLGPPGAEYAFRRLAP